MTLREMVDEYNRLTGQNIKKFQDRATAERRLAEIRPKEKVKMSKTQHKVTCNGETYRSVFKAFEANGLPINKHIAFRTKLFAAGSLDFVHEDKTCVFEVIS